MANPSNRHIENVSGPWYVDETCVICGMCGEYAPEIFRTSTDGTQNVVHHQPASPKELAAAHEAMSNCPTDSIGNNCEIPAPATAHARS